MLFRPSRDARRHFAEQQEPAWIGDRPALALPALLAHDGQHDGLALPFGCDINEEGSLMVDAVRWCSAHATGFSRAAGTAPFSSHSHTRSKLPTNTLPSIDGASPHCVMQSST